ncbi:MAG: CHAD domain-containing protein [Bryobacteraceae bacterium]|jgi:CHAD domain-containing protein
MTAATVSPAVSPLETASALLDHLANEMRKAAKKPDSDAVHDVRVAIRRTRECLKIFAPAFPSRAARSIDKKLSKVLEAAGELRNLDIAIELLKASGLPKSGELIRELGKDRLSRAADFSEALEELDIVQKWKSKLAGKEKENLQPADVAQETLPGLAAGFFEAGQSAADPAADSKTLHKFRIRSKKFRYALELFAPQYGPTLEKRMEVLKNIQTRLGNINDCFATQALLDEYRKGHKPLVDQAKEKLAKKALTQVRAFRAYWHKSMDQAQRDTWIEYLSHVPTP